MNSLGDNGKKHLRKSANKLIFGVCAGVAEYLDVDPTLVRVIWALLILLYGTGVLVYLILALIMPKPVGSL
ncbi:phage shock protein C (PspC) family protein [Verrucomicrobium sp. GAS474]|uniref:PspC domain-containing protein n=1 Tax=Verrucomicrobium sp. GAS474 TaxID=1882831 RepID=UPI00087DB85F|nr:PspC domain-containing protein [Verrucomicrobium sp. GAS474]SDU02413.1 phage shock protein C (PspC) family protein [Verrucomicrobium sp. GAS474]